MLHLTMEPVSWYLIVSGSMKKPKGERAGQGRRGDNDCVESLPTDSAEARLSKVKAQSESLAETCWSKQRWVHERREGSAFLISLSLPLGFAFHVSPCTGAALALSTCHPALQSRPPAAMPRLLAVDNT